MNAFVFQRLDPLEQKQRENKTIPPNRRFSSKDKPSKLGVCFLICEEVSRAHRDSVFLKIFLSAPYVKMKVAKGRKNVFN
jgi:hypothetical protein